MRATLLTVLVAMLHGCAIAPERPIDLAVRNVTAIDAITGVRAGVDVLIDKGRIVGVEPGGTKAASAAEVIDGSGRYLIPGLWDMHVHVTYEPDLTDAMRELFLSYGITSVRDTGGLLDRVKPVVDAWRAPGAVAPRIFFSGPLLDGRFVVYDGGSVPHIGVDTPDVAAARARIAEMRAAGVDFVKFYEMVSPSVFGALADAAGAAGLPIAAHVPLSLTAEVAGPRVGSMEHLRNVELACAADAIDARDERRELLKNPTGLPGHTLRRNLHSAFRPRAIAALDQARCDLVIESLRDTIQVPTLRLNTLALHQPYDRADWVTHVQRLPPAAAERWLALARRFASSRVNMSPAAANWSLSLVKRMHSAGVPIGAGTDTPIGSALPGYSLHTELERLVTAGLTPLDALRAATIRPAEFLSLDDSMGQIRAGFVADLVLLNADPLADIANTRAIGAVISKGKRWRGGAANAR